LKKLTKNLFLLTSAAAVATVVTSAPSTVSAEAKLSSLVFEYQDGTQFVVEYSAYIDAIVAESGDMYELVKGDDVELKALGVDGSAYVDYSQFVTELLDDSEGRTAIEVLGDLSTDTSHTIDEDTVATYETISGFSDDGDPLFGEAETPEVISID